MKLVIGFALLSLSHAPYTPKCDDVIVHNIHHKKDILVVNKDSPYQLSIDYDKNTLFFSYSNNDNENDDIFSSAFLNLKTNRYNTIPGIASGFASTVDNKNGIVYLGGRNGLYKFDYKTKTATHVKRTYHNIWQMFFKNDVYYSTYPNERVYVFRNGTIKKVRELADTRATLVVLNNHLDFYYTNSSGLFKRTKSDGNTVQLGDYNANAMTADSNGNLYFSTPDGIYSISEDDKVDEIALIHTTYGVAIESDGTIIYASSNAIVRLKPTKSPCSVD